jgi:hemolysin activation/secretion protein
VKKLGYIDGQQHKILYLIGLVAHQIDVCRSAISCGYVIRLVLLICALSFSGTLYAEKSVSSDPYLVKEYPDGTKVKVRWSQIGRTIDAGVSHGGPPTMRAIQPGEENIPEAVPVGGFQPAKQDVGSAPVQESVAAEPVPVPQATNPVAVAPVVPLETKGSSDVKVLKVYPDGTQVVVRWSELGATMDQGETHGGPPKIVAYNPGGMPNTTSHSAPSVPITQRSQTQLSVASTEYQPPVKPIVPMSSPNPSSAKTESTVGGTSVSKGFGSTFNPSMGPSLQYGQSFQDYGPKTMPSGPMKPVSKTSRPSAFVSQSDEEVTANLTGIVFLGTMGEVAATGRPTSSGIKTTVPGLSFSEVSRIAQPYMGKAVNFGDLDDICRQVMAYFESVNQPVVTALVPEQEIRGGVVQILVVRGKMGQVSVEGNRYFKSENLKSVVRLKEGEDIDLGTLTDDMNWLNGNPFRQVEPSLSPGQSAGQTDVVLEVKDRFPIRPYVSYDNFGIQSLGYDRYSAGASMIDIWSGWDQQLNYQYLTSGGFNALISNSGSYSVALPWEHSLTVLASYSKSNPDAVGPMVQSGYYWQVSGRYNIPLPTLNVLDGLDYRHQVYAGYDFKAANSDLFFNGAALDPVYNGLVGLYNISQFVLGYGLNQTDPLGSTSFETVLYGSPGGMSSNNNNTSFQNIDGGADAQYIYGKFSLNRVFRLPGDACLMLSGQIQQADSNLMPSESFGIGGYDTVRGYDQRSSNGDNGYLGNIEIRTPPISIWQLAGAGEALDQLVFLGFLDYGQVLQYSSDTITSVNSHLMSVGPGLRYNIGPYFNVRFDWGFQLQQAPPGTTGGSGGRSGTSQAVLSATLAY